MSGNAAVPSVYDTWGNLKAGPSGPASVTDEGYYWLTMPVIASSNWTPSYVNGARLVAPYSGVYAASFLFYGSSNCGLELFIDLNGGQLNDNGLIAAHIFQVGDSETTLTATVYMSAGENLGFGFFQPATSGTIAGFRCRITVVMVSQSAA